MSAIAHPVWCGRANAAMPFLIVGALAIVGGGTVAAAMAHAPSRKLMWAVAYLVLVVGVMQAVLGIGQALLVICETAASIRALECVMFNLGNAGVIVGTLLSFWPLVLAGTLLFALALAIFLQATRCAKAGWLIRAYRVLIVCIGGSAIVGLVLGAARAAA